MHISARLSKQIELGAVGRDTMELIITRSDGGFEDINRPWDQYLCEYEITYPLRGRTDALFLEVRNAFRATGGGEHSFDFWDWRDYQAEDEGFGEGDGADTTFQLVKAYSFGSLTHTRRIQRPVTNDADVEEITFEIQADGVPVAEADYTVSSLGVVTFDVAPLNGVVLTWSGEFNVPVRFDKVIQSAAPTTDQEKFDSFLLVEKRLRAEDFA